MTRNLRIALLAALAVGIVLRLAHYVRRGSLWIDEAMLAISIVSRPPGQLLFTPLENSQMAPPGFLQAAKLSTMVFGPSELALRLPALAASLIALILFVMLAKETLREWEIFFAVAAFAIAPMILTYSADAKQYTTDLAAALALTLAVIRMRKSGFTRRAVLETVAAGAALVWFSDASALVMAGLGLALASLTVLERDGRASRAARVVAPVWIGAILAQQVTVTWRMEGSTAQVMQRFWTRKLAFMPFPPESLADVGWLPATIGQTYREGLGLRGFRGACLILAVLGAIALWRRGRRDVVLLLGAPVIVTLAASALKAYPFADRLVLFLLPSLAVAAAAGAGFVTRPWPRVQPLLMGAILLLLLVTPRYSLTGEGPPWRRQEMKPVLAALASHRRPGDKIYVAAGAVPALEFYQQRYGISEADWVSGRGHGKPGEAVRDLEPLRGSPRVWIVLSYDHPYPRHQEILDLVAKIGTRIPGEGYPPSNVPRGETSLHLFNLEREPVKTGSR